MNSRKHTLVCDELVPPLAFYYVCAYSTMMFVSVRRKQVLSSIVSVAQMTHFKRLLHVKESYRAKLYTIRISGDW